MRIPLHAPSDRSAVFHFVASLTDMHAPLHAPSDWSAVFHFVAPLIGVHTIYMFLLLTCAFSHYHETLTLPLLCPNGSCACTRHDTNPPYSQKILQWWYYGVNILKMQNRDTKVYVWTSTRQRIVCSASKVTICSSVYQTCQVVVNGMLHQQGDNMVIMYQSCRATATVEQDDSHYK